MKYELDCGLKRCSPLAFGLSLRLRCSTDIRDSPITITTIEMPRLGYSAATPAAAIVLPLMPPPLQLPLLFMV